MLWTVAEVQRLPSQHVPFVIFGRLLTRAFCTLPQSPQEQEGVLNFWYPKIRILCKFLATSTHVRWVQPKLSSKKSLDCRQWFLQRNHNTCSQFGTSLTIFHNWDAAQVRLLTQPTKHSFKIPVTTKRRDEISLDCRKTNHSRLDQCFSTAGPRPGAGPWHQLYRAARGSPGVCHFNFLSNFHE